MSKLEELKKKKYDASKPAGQGWEDQSIEKCANLISTSLYKMQLGINSVKDEVKNQTDVLLALTEQLERIANALENKK